ncbi:MAG: Fic family protein [Candidatus Diapherotrites archaeon]
MRIPEKPPSDKELWKVLSEKLTDKNAVIEREPYLSIINSNYLHWDQLPMDERFKGVDIKLLWAFVKLSRDSNSRKIKLDGIKLHYVQTPNIEKTLHDLDVRVGGKIKLESQIPSPKLNKKYLVNSLMEEAIASSQLEGAVTTRVVAKKMLVERRKPRNHSEQMIFNNYLTMMHIKEYADSNRKLNLDFIKEIHKKITKDTLEKKEYEGEFRKSNEIKVFSRDGSNIIHDPPEYNKINKLLEELCDFINNIDSYEYYLHPFVVAMVLHYMVGYIHPFNDGNGRTARALFYWYLILQKYDYLEYIAVSTAIKKAPAQYARAYLYSETDDNDITYFVIFNLRALDAAVKSFEKYVNKTREENKKIFETVHKNPKLNFRQADILINMSKHERALTISEMQERYNITYQTARVDLLKLVKQDYLKQVLRGKQFLFILNKDKCLKIEN